MHHINYKGRLLNMLFLFLSTGTDICNVFITKPCYNFTFFGQTITNGTLLQFYMVHQGGAVLIFMNVSKYKTVVTSLNEVLIPENVHSKP